MDGAGRPYFLWDMDLTMSTFQEKLRVGDAEPNSSLELPGSLDLGSVRIDPAPRSYRTLLISLLWRSSVPGVVKTSDRDPTTFSTREPTSTGRDIRSSSLAAPRSRLASD